MLEKLFLQILSMSFTASFVILAVIAVRFLLKKAPHVVNYAMWAVVLFRLVCPFSFESAVSLLPVRANPITQEIFYNQTPQTSTDMNIIAPDVNALIPAVTPVVSENPMGGILAIGSLLWLWGIAVLAIYSAVSLWRLKHKLREAVLEDGNVYLAQGLGSPFVLGLFHPKIYLPDKLTETEKRYIILHERTHIKRLDHVVKIVSFSLLCLHWFNPLVWLAFFLCGKDMEMSCDEAVIKKLGADVKKDYSSSLLTLATGRRIVSGSPLAFGEGDTKSRIKNVLNYKKPAIWAVLVSVILVVAISVGLLANPKDNIDSQFGSSAKDILNRYTIALAASDITKMRLLMPMLNPPTPEVIDTWGQIKIESIKVSDEDIRENKAVFELLVTVKEVPEGFEMLTPGTSMYYLYAEQCDKGWYVESCGREGRSQGDLEIWWNSPNLIDGATSSDFNFTAVTMTEHVNGEDREQVKITDPAEINGLGSLLIIDEFTNIKSVNDAPSQENYIRIIFEDGAEPLYCYVYEDGEKYYVERPYNGIWEINIDTLDQLLTMMTDKNIENEGEMPKDVEKFLSEISQSFRIKEGVARFIVPGQMPEGYATSQLGVHVSGSMPMGDDGSNMSLHAYDKGNEVQSWQLGKEYAEKMFNGEAPDKTKVYASFYLNEENGRGSKYYTTVSKIFPLREDHFTPSVAIAEDKGVQTITFSDRFNDKLTLECLLPVGWSLEAPIKGDGMITGAPVEIYDGSVAIGSLLYDNFELYGDKSGDIPYMSVYNGIMLGSVTSWDNEYVELDKDEMTCVATCKPRRNLQFPGVSNAGAATVYSKGILAYHTRAKKYIAMSLKDGAVTKEQWMAIAESVKLF